MDSEIGISIEDLEEEQQHIHQQEKLSYAHMKEIHKQFGKKVKINFGWGSTENSIASKIYEKNCVLTTREENGKYIHYITPY